MGIDREDIERIAKATADEVVHQLKGNPYREHLYAECSCGQAATLLASSVYHAYLDSEKDQPVSAMTESMLQMGFRNIEHACPADMARVEDVVYRLKQGEKVSDLDVTKLLDFMYAAFSDCMKEARKDRLQEI